MSSITHGSRPQDISKNSIDTIILEQPIDPLYHSDMGQCAFCRIDFGDDYDDDICEDCEYGESEECYDHCERELE